MPCFEVTLRRIITEVFYMEAEDEELVHAFMDDDPDWLPGDVPGLVETVESEEDGYTVTESKVMANWQVGDDLELEETV
jgi:hypothetical protein